MFSWEDPRQALVGARAGLQTGVGAKALRVLRMCNAILVFFLEKRIIVFIRFSLSQVTKSIGRSKLDSHQKTGGIVQRECVMVQGKGTLHLKIWDRSRLRIRI